MAIDIDGLAVLRAIAATPRIFPDAATEINNFARKLVSGQLKPATINLERLRDIYSVIGYEAFPLILDGHEDKASAALVKKLDKDNPEFKTASPVWCRKRLADLASGVAQPAAKPEPSPPKKTAKGMGAAYSPEQTALAKDLKGQHDNPR